MSFSGPDDPLLGDLIREGQRRGMLFVGAAAEASDLQNGLLQREGMIPVASDDKRSTLESALYAPGREILTLLPGAHYDFASGASIATAQVSGVVALMLAKNPGLSAGLGVPVYCAKPARSLSATAASKASMPAPPSSDPGSASLLPCRGVSSAPRWISTSLASPCTELQAASGLEAASIIRRDRLSVHSGAVVSRRESSSGARRYRPAPPPTAAIEIGQVGHFVLRHLADHVSLANISNCAGPPSTTPVTYTFPANSTA